VGELKTSRHENLNHVLANFDCGDAEYVAMSDPQVSSGAVTCFFRDIEEHLLHTIDQYPIVVGCVAWLTSVPVLKALARRKATIIIQKEDFLRPDSPNCNMSYLRPLYEEITGAHRFSLPPPLCNASICGEPDAGGVRCMGIARDRAAIPPRMHHKFLVFGRPRTGASEKEYMDPDSFTWEAVWTGSFNMTKNANLSLENAVLIKDPVVACAYVKEFAQVALRSEPLDWNHEWVDPEWRLGT
jgi:hypothetical protein